MKLIKPLIALTFIFLTSGCIGLHENKLLPDPIRIDISSHTRRSDTGAEQWQEWQFPNGSSGAHDFGPIKITLRQGDANEPGLEGQWFKKALAAGARLACDGVFVPSGSIEIVLEGLPPGPHSLVTYHNSFWSDPLPPYRIWVGSETVMTDLKPTNQVQSDEDMTTAFIPLNVQADTPVIIRIEANEPGPNNPVILNALEIDASNPSRQAAKPNPGHGDQHVDGDDGQVTLHWTPAPKAIRHRVYLAHAHDFDHACLALRKTKPTSTCLMQTTTSNHIQVSIIPHDSLMYYAWRVDSIDAQGRVTPGDIWTFRLRHLAFPGAEGYGRFALGGRGGRVFHVTNLNDSGPGSLREAIEADEPRTVIFDVSGLISLESRLIFRNPFLTVAGQTAPGKGICIRNYSFGGLGAHDTIIRHLRLRLGDLAGKTMDGMGLASCDHCIIDHCSISWTQDEAFSSRGARNITLQYCLISEALNVAGHARYAAGKQHGYAASIGGDIGSFHHNLLVHCAGRNWSLAGGLDKAGRHTGRLDLRNNVVYNWGHRTTDGGAQYVQFVNNYYKPGPASRVFHVLKPERNNVAGFGPQDYYVSGNVMEGHYDAHDPLTGVVEPKEEPLSNFIKEAPFFVPHVTTHTAIEAYEFLLTDVGCNVPTLDDHDKRIIKEVDKGVTLYHGSRSQLPGLPDSQVDVGGWEDYPELHRPADWDTDADGMPDHWERDQNLDPNDPSDGPLDTDADGYTNLEEYLNQLTEA